jgi:hypothetical protein
MFHVPFPYDQGYGDAFERRIDSIIDYCNQIIILCSELHDRTVDFVLRYNNPKIQHFICGSIDGCEYQKWMDWIITTVVIYKNNTVLLDQLQPYSPKPKTFDILLGRPRFHRDILYAHINESTYKDNVIMTYMQNLLPIHQQETDGWIWEEPGVVVPDHSFRWTVTPVKYYDRTVSLSQVIPLSIYNQTAYTIVAETNFASHYAFHTEKIVKPILGRRLFIVFGGRHYLKSLHNLGFKTFNNIIDEDYDNEINYVKRGAMICKQIDYLMLQDQQTILDQIKPIAEHNYQVMMSTDWQGQFHAKLKTVLTETK